MHETLITHHCKIMKHGYFYFLSKHGASFKIQSYHYSINKKTNTVTCTDFYEKIVEPEELPDYYWKTSEDFNRSNKGSWREKYYEYFSENFLSLSNDDKLKIIDELSKRERSSGPLITNQGMIYDREVHSFEDIPSELLAHLDKMGVDDSSIFNEYESSYINSVFCIRPEINLAGKRVAFLHLDSNKKKYFNETKERYKDGSGVIGGSALYIFDTTAADDCGYDAAIVYWSKVLIPIDKVIKRLKNRK